MSTVKTKNVQIGADGTASNNFTIYQPSTPDGTSRWAVGVSGATTADVVTVNNSGNVGIGTTSPNGKFESYANSGYSVIANSSAGSVAINPSSNAILFGTTNVAAYATGNYDAATHVYKISGTERMRIDSNGLVGINTAPNAYGQFAIKWDATATANNGSGIGMYPTANTSGAKFLFFYNEAGSGIGSISRNTTTNAVLYNTTSDYRLKTDIEPINNALSIVSQLKPVSFTWDGTEQKDTGFIAHELQAVIPNIVTGEKDATTEDGKPIYQSVDYSKLVATLTAAIQELKAELDALKAKVN